MLSYMKTYPKLWFAYFFPKAYFSKQNIVQNALCIKKKKCKKSKIEFPYLK